MNESSRPSTPSARATRRRLLGLLLAAGPVLAACAALGPRTVTLDEDELARLLERRFPLHRPLLDLFDVTVAAPRVRLLPERNRLATELDLAVVERITGRPLQGGMALDGELRWEASDDSLRLSQVRVQRVQLGASTLPPPLQRVGGWLAEQVLEDMVLWQPTPQQLQRLGGRIGAVTVTSRGVEVTFGPR